MYIAESTDTPCQESNPRFWFAKPETKKASIAKSLCQECPERIACLNSVVRYEQRHGSQHGIYGGLDMRERAVFLDLPMTATA